MQGTEKLIDQAAVTRVLSESVIRVAGDELARLSADCPGEEVARNIHSALRNFGHDLRQGTSFDYDDWAAVLYLLWYQPRRVQSVYQLLKAWPIGLNGLSDRNKSPFVADFACGAGAMASGTALALADVVLNLVPVPAKPLPEIHVWSIDSSPAMLNIGQKLWTCFSRMVDTDEYVNTLHALSSACKAINIRWLSIDAQKDAGSFVEFPAQLGQPRYMSLLHGVYRDNQGLIYERMKSLAGFVEPDFVLATCHDDSDSRSRTNWAVAGAAERSRYLNHEFKEFPQQICGELDSLTNFRREVFKTFVKPHLRSMSNDDADFVEKYLTSRPVEWFRDDVAFSCYSKR